MAAQRSAATDLPAPLTKAITPVDITQEGWWLVLSDIHLPFHDVQTLELAVKTAKDRGVKGILLNGDTVDCHELSRFDKRPDDPTYREEVQTGRKFMEWLRAKLPEGRILFKDGNHEERLTHYLCRKAPALYGLDVLNIPSLLQFQKYGAEHITDKRVVRLGRLNVLHGHEYLGGIQTPVNPARGLFLRTKASSLCGHFHQPSEHHEPTIVGKPIGCWSTGCACYLSPQYMPYNKWGHGFALVEIYRGGHFRVNNLRVLDGEVV